MQPDVVTESKRVIYGTDEARCCAWTDLSSHDIIPFGDVVISDSDIRLIGIPGPHFGGLEDSAFILAENGDDEILPSSGIIL